MLVCALCDTREATIGRTCDPCSRRLLSQLGDVEQDAQDLFSLGSVLGAVKMAGDPYAFRGNHGFGPSEPADLRLIAARDPRTRPDPDPTDRLSAPVEVLADWADCLRDDLAMPPGRRTVEEAAGLLRRAHAHLCAAPWLTEYAGELVELRGFLGSLSTSTRDRRRLLGDCLDPDCPGRVWTAGGDPVCDACGDTYDARRLAVFASAIEREDTEHVAAVTVQQAAEVAGVRPNTVRTWVRRGKVRQVGRSGGPVRVDLADVLQAHDLRRRPAA